MFQIDPFTVFVFILFGIYLRMTGKHKKKSVKSDGVKKTTPQIIKITTDEKGYKIL